MEKLNGSEEMRQLMSNMDIDKDFRFTHGNITISNPVSLYINEELTEGLIKTYPIDKTINYIKKYFQLNDRMIYPISTESDEEQIRVVIPNIGKNKELMDKAMNLCGWYSGIFYTKNEHTISGIIPIIDIQYERKFNKDYTENILDETIYFYHVSPSVYENKIRKNGLMPYSRNRRFSYPERIHLLTDVTLNDLYVDDDALKNVAEMLYNADMKNGDTKKGCMYTVYQIDSDLLPDSVRLYRDPNMENAVYTTDAIPPSTFVNVAHINLDEDTIVWEQ